MNNSTEVWIKGFCTAVEWMPTSNNMDTNDFINIILDKIVQLSGKRYKKFVHRIKSNIPVLKSYKLYGAHCIKSINLMLAVFIRKVAKRNILHFDTIFPSRESNYDKPVVSGGITITRDQVPKSLSCRTIKMLNHIFREYYHGIASNFEQTLKIGEEGYTMNTIDLLKEITNLNCFLRWWDFINDDDKELKQTNQNTLPTNTEQLQQIDSAQRIVTCPSVNSEKEKFEAKNEIKLQLQYYLGFSQALHDELIFRLYVTPAGEVTSITSILDAKAMDRKMGIQILSSALLIPWNGSSTGIIHEINTYLSKGEYYPKHPLVNQTIDFKLPERKQQLLRQIQKNLYETDE